MPFQIIRNDITKVKADAIVNTANPKPVVGGGTDSAIYAAAGEKKLLAERMKIGDIPQGHSVSTKAFALKAKYILHTVGPVWVDGNHGERETLRFCYRNALALASQLRCKSVAFPLMASGVNGFPKDEALEIALSEIGSFLLTHEMKVLLVVFDSRALQLSEQLVGEIDRYIDEHTVRDLGIAEYGEEIRENRHHAETARRIERERRMRLNSVGFAAREERDEFSSDMAPMPSAASFPVMGKSLEEVLGEAGETFQQRLFRLIDESGMDDVTVYKKANIDRKVFSRIRCREDYRPQKKTAVAFAIALRLDLPTTLDLLSRAEIAFSPSSKFDLIVSFFITHGNYDIHELNAVLFKYGQETIGTQYD